MEDIDLEQVRRHEVNNPPPFCDYVFVKGLKRGQKCTDFGRYGGRCCKHKVKTTKASSKETDVEEIAKSRKQKAAENTNKLREDEIFNENVQEPNDHDEKVKSSVWNITINSNTDYDKLTDNEKKKFKRFVDFIFDENGIFDFLTDMNSPEDPMKNIDDIHTDYYFENSSKNLLHCHGILRIHHHGHFKLEVNKIRALAKSMFGKNIHLDAPVTSDYAGSWENYMRKQGIRGKLEF